jgi:hypothetical protein
MSTTTYGIRIDASQAERTLSTLQNQILGIGAALTSAFTAREIVTIAGRFQDLRVSLGAVYKDAAQGNRVFEDIKTFAAESVFSVEDLTQTVIKLRAAGLNPSIEQLRLFADVSSVSADSIGALQAITDLFARTTEGGLGLEDLNRLADRGIPVFKILSEQLGLSRLEIAKVGQTAEGAQTILAALTRGLQQDFGGAQAQRVGTLNQAFSNLGDSIANAADAIGQAGLTDAIAAIAKGISDFVSNNQALIAQIGGALAGALDFLRENFKTLITVGGTFFAVFAVQRILAIASAFLVLSKAVLSTPWGRIAALAGVVAGAFVTLTDNSADLNKEIEETSKKYKELDKGTGQAATGTGNLRARVDELDASLKKARQSLQDISDGYARSAQSSADALRQQLKATESTRDQARQDDLRGRINEDTQNRLIQLTKEYNSLGEKERQKVTADFVKRYDEIIKTGELRKKTELTLSDAIAGQQQRTAEMAAASKSLLDIEQQRQRLQAQFQIEQAGPEERIRLEERLAGLERVRAQGQEAIARATNLTAREQIELNNLLGLATTRTQALGGNYETAQQAVADLVTQIGAGTTEGAKLSGKLLEILQTLGVIGDKDLTNLKTQIAGINDTFEQGAAKAVKAYSLSIPTAGQQGFRLVGNALQQLEDQLVNFVTTGKFSFKDLFRSIAADFARNQIRGLLNSLIGGGGGGGAGDSILGSIVSGITGFLGGGRAAGGPVSPGRAYTVGESGPETFVPAGMGTIVPGAGGGTVIYNIQAVDAPSFQALVARDPEFIYAVTERGRRSLPGTRR